MKLRILLSGHIFLALMILFTPLPVFSENISFSEKIGSDIMPIEPGNTFVNNTLNISLSTENSFGISSIIFSLYKVNPVFEELLLREEINISPTWNYFLIRNFPFPQIGKYKISITEPHNSSLIAEGVVEILKETVVYTEVPKTIPKDSQEGKSIKEIFDIYKPK